MEASQKLSKSQQDLQGLQFNAVNRTSPPKTMERTFQSEEEQEQASEDEPAQLRSKTPTPAPSIKHQNSLKGLKNSLEVTPPSSLATGRPGSDAGSQFSRDNASVRSWASVGMGSTDGKKMIIRRVPTTPVELFNIVNPPTKLSNLTKSQSYPRPLPKVDEHGFVFPIVKKPPEEYLYDAESLDGASEEDDEDYMKPRRYHWSNKLQFVLACIGYSVGLGSVWRFPYLCYQSGGGVFLIPYVIIMVICGVPMLYMEIAVGQFTGRGPIGALGHLCPLLKGTGVGSVLISFLMSTYYSVIIAYGIYYFFTSFKVSLPWDDCSHRWNTADCWVPERLKDNHTRPNNSRTPSEEFYDGKVLHISAGIEELGALRWELVACLLCAWILVYFAIWKSIKSSAKARYFTATIPLILIIIFLAKSLTLEGADKGMRYFFKPKFELLADAKVWVNAMAQTFNSMGIAFGSMISFASYNKFNNNILHDTLAVSFVNCLTSLLVGIFSFAIIGNIATEQNTSIERVVADGPGLIFVVYPQALAKMPAAHFWAALLFFMLLCLSLNSQFAIVEVVVTSIQDGFPTWIKRKLMCHEVLVLIVCVVSFLLGLPNVTEGGIYFFQLMDHYTAHISIMYLGFFELVAIAWIYGTYTLSDNIQTMTGKQPSWYMKLCWMIVAPAMICAIWVACVIDYEAPTYNNGEYEYPTGAVVFGWIISSISILCIPIFMIYSFIQTQGNTIMEKFRNTIKSDLSERCPKCAMKECDCFPQPEENEPMLVFQGPQVLNSLLPYPPITQLGTSAGPGTISRAQTDINLNGHIQRDSSNIESGTNSLPR